jgi:hypothetical protein
MADILSTALVAAGGAVMVTAGILAVRAFGNARLLAEAAPTPVNALEEGLHEVAGRLAADDTLRAPLTGRPCLFYRLLLEQRRRNRWEPVLDQKESTFTRLLDETGEVALTLDDADVVVSSPDRVRTGIFSVPSAELSELLSRVAAPTTPPAGPFLRWREEILVPGDRVFAVGTAARHGEVWQIGGGDGQALVSDREEVEVVRHQRRAGQRWAAIGLVGVVAAAYGSFGLL